MIIIHKLFTLKAKGIITSYKKKLRQVFGLILNSIIYCIKATYAGLVTKKRLKTVE